MPIRSTRSVRLLGYAASVAALLIYLVPAAGTEAADDFYRLWPDNLFAVEFPNEETGFIAGYGGSVIRTTDGGKSWEFQYIGRNELVRRMSFADESNGWAVGHRGSIFHTKDSGKSWVVQHEVPGIYLRDIDFADKNNGWAVGHNANIWHTSDGGKTWRQQELKRFAGRDLPRLHGIYAISDTHALLAGEFGVVAHTEDGGENWLTTPTGTDITWLAIEGDGENIFIAGLEGNIARLRVATEDEVESINSEIAKAAAERIEKVLARAARRGQELTDAERQLPEVSDYEYVVEPLDSGTNEHFLDIDVGGQGQLVIVGRSSVLQFSENVVQPMQGADGFPLPFVWVGGVALTPAGEMWGAGIRGLVIRGNIESNEFGQAFNLAASQDISVVSSRWETQK